VDEEQISHLKEHYSEMTDEELADLLVTRGNSLTEEAYFALKIILKKRNIETLEKEFTEKREFYIAENQLAVQQADKAKKQKKEDRKLVRTFFLFGIFVGVLIMIFDNFDAGLNFSGIMVVGYIYFEWKAIVSTVFLSLFRSKK
jgi:hypothetical protein